MTDVSIIIPTFNEATCLRTTLRQLSILDPLVAEVIVVDGGSTDETISIAKDIFETFPLEVRTVVIHSEGKGRSLQLNQGAEISMGSILCFLHADTIVPIDLVTIVRNTLSHATVSCGGFISLMHGKDSTQWGISLHNYLKTYYAPFFFRPHLFMKGLRLLFGDQVMFCRRKDFWDCDGFDPAMPIMEEADLCLKLCQKGRIIQVNRIVQSSDRRVAKWGAWKATAIYLYIGMLWGIGVSPDYLKRFYNDIR